MERNMAIYVHTFYFITVANMQAMTSRYLYVCNHYMVSRGDRSFTCTDVYSCSCRYSYGGVCVHYFDTWHCFSHLSSNILFQQFHYSDSQATKFNLLSMITVKH